MNLINSFLLSILLVVAVSATPNTDYERLRDELDELKKQVSWNFGAINLINLNFEHFHEVKLQYLRSYRNTPPGNTTCGVGIADGRVTDEQMTASSQWDERYSAAHGRLNADSVWHCEESRHRGADWIQVDLRSATRLVGIITQGKKNSNQWTRNYKIIYSVNGSFWIAIKDDLDRPQTFRGNTNGDDHSINYFRRPITARYVRLVITSYTTYYPVIRMELLTC